MTIVYVYFVKLMYNMAYIDLVVVVVSLNYFPKDFYHFTQSLIVDCDNLYLWNEAFFFLPFIPIDTLKYWIVEEVVI